MPRIIDYPDVLGQLTADGLECHYYNGGAFGYPAGGIVRGWIAAPDPTIKAEMLSNIRAVPAQNLPDLAARVWLELLPGPVWVMPGSHWSYELNYGSRQWLPDVLGQIGIDSSNLISRTAAAAIEFALPEQAALKSVIQNLLQKLTASDFTMAFPGRAAICTIHHHQQLWWASADAELIRRLDSLIEPGSAPSVGSRSKADHHP